MAGPGASRRPKRKSSRRALDAYVTSGRRDQPYEEPMRDVMLAEPHLFGIEDVTGMPWIEIDFPEDLATPSGRSLPLLPLRLPVRRRVNGLGIARQRAAAPCSAARAGPLGASSRSPGVP